MKTLSRLVLLLLLAAAGAGYWARQSPYFTLYQVDDGLQRGDVAQVERFADLTVLSRTVVDMAAAVAQDEATKAGGDVVGSIAGALARAFGAQVGQVVGPASVDDVRRAIVKKELVRGVGPFVLDHGLAAVGTVQEIDSTTLVEVRGSCDTRPATLQLILQRQDDGPVFGRPPTWRITGVDKASLVALAHACVSPPPRPK